MPVVSRRSGRSLALLVLAAGALLVQSATGQAAPLIGGLGGPAGYGADRLFLNDDGSSSAINTDVAFPMGLQFFGMTFHEFYLNNNGNITFGASLGTYTPRAFPIASQRMIAPWWGDVDTRGGSLSDPNHDAVTWDVRPGQVTVTWHNVGYFSMHDDMQNDFQLIMRQFSGCGFGDFDVEFRYNQCQWVAGDASGGMMGHGGTPAQAGFDGGDGVHFYALPGSLSESILDLCRTSNVGEPGVWRFRIRGGELPCAGAGMNCDTGMMGGCAAGITVCQMGVPTCLQLAPASNERCDGVDNDCNGMVDEGNLCPPSYTCDRGACVPVCVEGGCFADQTCTPTGACVDNACLNVQCPAGLRCVAGACVDPCIGLHCPMPSVCRQGSCVVPCDGVICDADQVCEDGRCLANCRCRACPLNYSCAPDGTCKPGDCIGLDCAPGQVCLSAVFAEPGATAQCIDPCQGAICPSGQHCETGRCMPGAPPPPDAGVSADGGTISGDGGAVGDARRDGGLGFVRRPGCACAVPGNRSADGHRERELLTLFGALAALTFTRRRRAYA